MKLNPAALRVISGAAVVLPCSFKFDIFAHDLEAAPAVLNFIFILLFYPFKNKRHIDLDVRRAH